MITLEGTWFLVFMMLDGTLALCLLQNQHTAKSPTKSNEVQIVLIWELQRHFCIFLWVGKTVSMEPGIWKWAATFNDILTVFFQIYLLVLADVPEVRHEALEPLPWQSWTWQWEASPCSLTLLSCTVSWKCGCSQLSWRHTWKGAS